MGHLGVTTEDIEGRSPQCLLRWWAEDPKCCLLFLALTGNEGRGLLINHSTRAAQIPHEAGAPGSLGGPLGEG